MLRLCTQIYPLVQPSSVAFSSAFPCSFCQLSLHSHTETTDNMFHIQQYCPGTQAFGMYSILGWWQLFGYLSGLNTLIVEIVTERVRAVAEAKTPYSTQGEIPKDDLARLVKDLEKQMKDAAKNLEFEKAALLRDQITDLRKVMVEDAAQIERTT